MTDPLLILIRPAIKIYFFTIFAKTFAPKT